MLNIAFIGLDTIIIIFEKLKNICPTLGAKYMSYIMNDIRLQKYTQGFLDLQSYNNVYEIITGMKITRNLKCIQSTLISYLSQSQKL